MINPHTYGPPVPCDEPECCAITVADVIYAVAREWRILRTEMLSDRVDRAAVLPRHVAMYLARKHTFCSLPMIGRAFAGRDHTTVLHAVRKVERLLERDVALAERVFRIEQHGRL